MNTKDTDTSDHDILIELRTSAIENFQNLRNDIKDLKDGTHAQLTDHEQRLRSIERDFVPLEIYSPAHQVLIKQIESIKKYIWMGMGIVSVLVLGINIGIKFIN